MAHNLSVGRRYIKESKMSFHLAYKKKIASITSLPECRLMYEILICMNTYTHACRFADMHLLSSTLSLWKMHLDLNARG